MRRPGKHFKNKKETNEDIINRIFSLAKEGDYGMLPPPMDAQVALDELCRFFLGDDWYCVLPIHTGQVNTEIVYEIEKKYKNRTKVNRKR